MRGGDARGLARGNLSIVFGGVPMRVKIRMRVSLEIRYEGPRAIYSSDRTREKSGKICKVTGSIPDHHICLTSHV